MFNQLLAYELKKLLLMSSGPNISSLAALKRLEHEKCGKVHIHCIFGEYEQRSTVVGEVRLPVVFL